MPSFAHRGIILIEGFTVVEDKADVWTELFSWFVSAKISTEVSTNNSDYNFFATIFVIIRQEYVTIKFYSYSFLRVGTNFKFNILFAQMFRQQFETTFFAWEFLWKICLRVWGTAQILNREYIYNWTEVEKCLVGTKISSESTFYVTCASSGLFYKVRLLSYQNSYNTWQMPDIYLKVFWKIVTRRLKFLFTSISGVQWQDETNIMWLLYL